MSTSNFHQSCTPPRSPRQSPNFVHQLFLSIVGVFVWLVVGISSLLCVPSFLKRLCPDLYWAATQPVSSPCDYNEVFFFFLRILGQKKKRLIFLFLFTGENGCFEFSGCVESDW